MSLGRVGHIDNLVEGWEYCPWESGRPPEKIQAGLDWQARVAPLAGSGSLARCRLRFDARVGRRAWLRFAQTGGPAVFYLNGRRFYACAEGRLPVEMDIEDHAAPGWNELVVWRGLGGDGPLGGVELVDLPAVSLPDLAVRMRSAGGADWILYMEVTLENRTRERFEGQLELSVNGERLGGQAVSLERGLLTTLALQAAWQGRQTWSLRSPGLSVVEASLMAAEGRIDARRLACGLRELRVAGDAYLLNGERVAASRVNPGTFSSLAEATAGLALLKEMGMTVFTVTDPYAEFMLDAADRVGLLVEACLKLEEPARLSADPAFRDAAQEHGLRVARRDRNHPSLAAWRLEGAHPQARELANLLRAVDPGRAVLVDFLAE